MTTTSEALPELMAALFGRLRGQLTGEAMGDLRMSHLRVMSAVPGEGVNVTSLAQRVGMTKQGCGQFVTQLSATGHVRTAPDPRDGRVRLVFLTDTGERFMDGVYAAIARIEPGMAVEVGARRYATFKKVMAELAGQSG